MASLKRKRLSLSEKYKPITEVESGTKPTKVAEKYAVPRNLEIKKKLKGLFNLVRLAEKEKT